MSKHNGMVTNLFWRGASCVTIYINQWLCPGGLLVTDVNKLAGGCWLFNVALMSRQLLRISKITMINFINIDKNAVMQSQSMCFSKLIFLRGHAPQPLAGA